MTMASRLGQIITINPTKQVCNGLIVFLHGSGDTGQGIRHWVRISLQKELTFPHLKMIYPTSPIRSYTPLDGEFTNAWFDRKSISPKVPEDKETIDKTASEIVELIDKEHKNGIPYNRILIGGFSMGGAMAMQLGYRFFPQIAGVFSLSSFLNQNSLVYQHLEKNPNIEKPDLFMVHGNGDALVLSDWSLETCEKMKQFGINVTHKIYEELEHELAEDEIKDLIEWINKKLPQLPEK